MPHKAKKTKVVAGTQFYDVFESIVKKDYNTGSNVTVENCTNKDVTRQQLVDSKSALQDEITVLDEKITAVDLA